MKKVLISLLAIAFSLFLLSACGNKQEVDVDKPEVSTSEKELLEVQEKPAMQASSDNKGIGEATEEMVKLGTRSFIRCRSCHTLGLNQAHTVGPNLHGLFSATAGKKEGFNYSEALVESNIKWEAETLRKWLRSPSTFIPENKMAFAGISNDKELEALIIYLNENTQ